MRGFIVALAGSLCALALAQPPLPDERKTLACLVKGGPALQIEDAGLQPDARGLPAYVRLRLLFERADRPPVVEVLASTASAGIRDVVLAHVTGYRLPCLETRPLAAVQEFQFAPDLMPQGGPLQVVSGPATADRKCLTYPKELGYTAEPRVLDRALLALTFSGDATAKPEVVVLGTNGDASFVKAMLKNGKEWGQPCRKAGDWPLREEAIYLARMAGTHYAQFKKKRVSLSEFLGYMKDASAARVFFDLDTMQCPFALRWTLHESWGRNRVLEAEGDNPNRALLVEWMRGLHSGLQPDMMNRLIGESLLVDVPCGQLDLKGEAG
ncbi:hypothetical protein [Roseateles sp.]|uniref:hypothetical protein n=1 Tax=Roseateles sp. TaxID=1971397 RepID=UPI0025F5DECF|nr:hypothetical protein [Roseateles sp.]MBV8037439.1 hypothetical protein [Roseateles sp.]